MLNLFSIQRRAGFLEFYKEIAKLNMDNMMSFSETPKALLEEISETLHRSSVALIKVWGDENGKEAALHIGSGTLASMGKSYGVLTAQHVARELNDRCLLGLTIGREGQEVNFKIDKS